MTDPLAAGAFGMVRIQASLDTAEARLDTLAGQLDPAVEAGLRRRILQARRELDRLRDQKFPLTAREKSPFWRYLLDSADSEPSLPA